MHFVFILGTAGSGKSTLTDVLSEKLEDWDFDVVTLNLDPGVSWLPYAPDVDIRDYINIDAIMRDYQLGPNGALVAAVDMSINKVNEIKEELEQYNPDIVLVDTPGQMELFAYRNSGLIISSALTQGDFSIVFLVDSIFANRASDFLSALLLSSSIQSRFQVPQINAVSKIDILPKETAEKLNKWVDEPETLLEELISEEEGLRRELAQTFFASLRELNLLSAFYTISSVTGEGLDELMAEIQRIFTRGETLR
ncbi:MAG: GTPase [Candidatus Methanomethylicota archaeon]|uniref:GTPase n=1 Tax=Thermoproteota archaeon TaxID=2056631 RepID=A0A497ER64_9CREN|nr:MAG: GTPase [Candidatus Verstraetearchaeota archaeon]RLE52287.1 MAG: GTPase [Candidatus Verstraetearchaeota archaeon]